MSDKRNTQRKPSFLGGTITYNHDLWSADCVIKNISDGGAKLSGRNLPVLPDRFDLSIPLRKTKYRVQVRWRDRDQIGVLFEQAYPSEETQAVAKISRQPRGSYLDDDDVKPLRIVSDFAL